MEGHLDFGVKGEGIGARQGCSYSYDPPMEGLRVSNEQGENS